jgi:type II secretory pathway pseudopilin PulG
MKSMRARAQLGRHEGRWGFTLTELMVVVGLIALLISLLMPAITKARAAAQASVCLSNLRQMGTAWQMYLTDNKSRLPDYLWASPPATTDTAWRTSWLGILDSYKVRGDTLVCPSASEPIPFNYNKGFGNVAYAWSGKYANIGTVIHLNPTTWRDGSYGYNHYLTVNSAFGTSGRVTRIMGIKPSCEVPVLLDSVYADFQPSNGTEMSPAPAPPNLSGDDFPNGAPEHWRFLIARHGRAINGYMADGSARRIPLEQTYMLTWSTGWQKYRLQLPVF